MVSPVGNMRITPPQGGTIDGHYVAANVSTIYLFDRWVVTF